MEIIDLRSDTVTQPTPEMREAMSQAEVGDDVLEEDPTVNKLQELAAHKIGKESALFVPSGAMGNLVSVLTHCQRGDEVILGDRCHIFLNEVGGISALGGVHPRTVPNEDDGTLALDRVERLIRGPDIHYPPTRLICLENTQNYCSGAPLPVSYMDSAASLAVRHNLKVHLDGARIFNAAVALAADVRELTRQADSVMFCLSKGLSAPVGSLVCGTREFIRKARKVRKMLGGGMRQAGHLAAAGIVALEKMTQRLQEDHDNAQLLACGLAQIDGIRVDPKNVKTNIVFFELNHPQTAPEEFLERLESMGIKILRIDRGVFRAVLNRGVSRGQAAWFVESARSILQP
ncbi:MAG: low-specificity L-threonine aldolase [Nitrospinae bacterium]|nr:low-specificity L-threonine aldolase [Nitrospinota bacterium]